VADVSGTRRARIASVFALPPGLRLCSFVFMIFGFTPSMVYDYFHHHDQYEMKKKWLFISYVIWPALSIFVEFKGNGNVINLNWLLSLL
jgi:hypothetical protein